MWIKHLKSGQCAVIPDCFIGTLAQCTDYIKTKNK
jgi:hypothetical protein